MWLGTKEKISKRKSEGERRRWQSGDRQIEFDDSSREVEWGTQPIYPHWEHRRRTSKSNWSPVHHSWTRSSIIYVQRLSCIVPREMRGLRASEKRRRVYPETPCSSTVFSFCFLRVRKLKNPPKIDARLGRIKYNLIFTYKRKSNDEFSITTHEFLRSCCSSTIRLNLPKKTRLKNPSMLHNYFERIRFLIKKPHYLPLTRTIIRHLNSCNTGGEWV